MKSENLFEIKNLNCSYNKKDIVLKISELNIPKGKLIVLIGLSGSGKSTFLETLGLMNNTLSDNSEILFFPENEDVTYNYKELWIENNKTISHVRNKHFSFIFQNTNLMPNFTAYENIAITQMIQGISLNDSIKNIKTTMHNLGLSEIDKLKKSYELSGGEKQRVAFVRAISPSFSVIYGDEPTGNLDEKNSKELMTILYKNIKDNNRTAIIVSHNIELTEEFADIIIVIKKIDGYSEILNHNIFYSFQDNQINQVNHGKKSWKDSNNNIVKDIKLTVKNIMEVIGNES